MQVGGSGVGPGGGGGGEVNLPPSIGGSPDINGVNRRGFIRPVPRGYGGFTGLRHCRRPPHLRWRDCVMAEGVDAWRHDGVVA